MTPTAWSPMWLARTLPGYLLVWSSFTQPIPASAVERVREQAAVAGLRPVTLVCASQQCTDACIALQALPGPGFIRCERLRIGSRAGSGRWAVGAGAVRCPYTPQPHPQTVHACVHARWHRRRCLPRRPAHMPPMRQPHAHRLVRPFTLAARAGASGPVPQRLYSPCGRCIPDTLALPPPRRFSPCPCLLAAWFTGEDHPLGEWFRKHGLIKLWTGANYPT